MLKSQVCTDTVIMSFLARFVHGDGEDGGGDDTESHAP